MAELVGADWNLSEQKRKFDIAGMTGLLPILGSIGVASAAAVAGIDRMNPLYTSKRYGLNGEFDCYKLRTMPPTTAETPSIDGHADTRATKLGKVLRKLHFDEIPQTMNIYAGDMSLVGPRPLIGDDMTATMDILSPSEQPAWLRSRQTAKPAPFGLFQLRQHANNYQLAYEEVLYERAMCDIEYGNTATLKGDLSIITQSIIEGLGGNIFRKSSPDQKRGERMATLFGDVASSMGVHVDPEELSYWRAFHVAARNIDDAIDSHQDSNIDGMIADLLNGKPIGDMSDDEAAEFMDIYWQKPPEDRHKLLTAFMALPLYLERKLTASTYDQLAAVYREESILFASILHIDTSDRTDSSQRSAFNNWLDNFALASYMVDGALDLERDYKSGNVAVPPTLQGRLSLFQAGFTDGASALKAIPLTSMSKLAISSVHALRSGK